MAKRRNNAITALIESAMAELDGKQLYQVCEECVDADGDCPACDGRRFVAAGFSVGQVIRMVLRIEMLKR
jgi:hypothetical protein